MLRKENSFNSFHGLPHHRFNVCNVHVEEVNNPFQFMYPLPPSPSPPLPPPHSIVEVKQNSPSPKRKKNQSTNRILLSEVT